MDPVATCRNSWSVISGSVDRENRFLGSRKHKGASTVPASIWRARRGHNHPTGAAAAMVRKPRPQVKHLATMSASCNADSGSSSGENCASNSFGFQPSIPGLLRDVKRALHPQFADFVRRQREDFGRQRSLSMDSGLSIHRLCPVRHEFFVADQRKRCAIVSAGSGSMACGNLDAGTDAALRRPRG